MSERYDEYLNEHRRNVIKGFEWMKENLFPEFSDYLTESLSKAEYNIVYGHDKSKDDPEEYNAYDAYFYGGNKSYEVVQNFNKAWLNHIHKNPHHWQHWILFKDDPENNEMFETIDMPVEYIIEMVCDWWSFSWKTGNLYEIFNWYAKHRDSIQLNIDTRRKVEELLDMIHNKLDILQEAAGGAMQYAAE